MAFASKVERREMMGRDYSRASKILNNQDVTFMNKKNGDSGILFGKINTGTVSRGDKLYGNTQRAEMTSGVAGNMSGDGYPNGPKWKRATEPGNLKPGKASQKNNTTVMKMGQGDKSVTMKVTSKTPKELRGGRVR